MRNSIKKTIAGVAAITMLACPITGSIDNNSGLLSSVSMSASAIQVSGKFKEGYKLTGDQAKDMVAVATKQLDLKGKYLNYGEEWCADFVCEVSRKAGISTSVIPFKDNSSCNCSYLYNRLINKCNAKTVSSPKVGDLLFFQWDGRTTANLDHIAIVTAINGNKITYIGGNQDGTNYNNSRVSKGYVKNYKTDKTLIKIVRPNYKKSSSNNTSSKSSTASSKNTTSTSSETTYKIKSSIGAKVRSGCGLKYSCQGGLAKGSVVIYDKQIKKDGYVWYHIVKVKTKKSGSWGDFDGWVANV